MHPQVQLTTIVLATALALVTLELVRRNKLLEDYSILWFVLAGVMYILAFWKGSLAFLARLTGVVYEPSAAFISVMVICFALIMHFSVITSRLTRQVNRLTQQIALLTAPPPDVANTEE